MKTREKINLNMKSVNKIKEKKRKGIKKPKIKPKKEKVLIVAQEIKFARLLSGNEKKTRDRVLKSFKKWLLSCFARGYEFKEDDFIRVWKGLFYAVWMSDKPLVQEDLCESIAGILDLFPVEQIKSAFLMMRAGFRVLATEWYGIDHHRMDKFLMLVRRYLRGSLRCVARCNWDPEVCAAYATSLAGEDGILALNTPPYARNAESMLIHVVDCFLEELAKVSGGAVPGGSVLELVRPLCAVLVRGGAALRTAARRLLTALLRQSRAGLLYRERTRAWHQMGCPRGGPDALELVTDDEDDEEMADDDDEEEENNGALDPRAGRVHVRLRSVPVPARALARLLRALLPGAGSQAYRRTSICLQRFEQLANDQYPLRVPDVFEDEDEPRPRPTEAAKTLRLLEKKLVTESDELALRGLSRKHRKRLLARRRAGLSIVDDVTQGLITSANGEWAVEATESNKKNDEQADKEEKTSNKENLPKGKNTKKRGQTDTNADNKRNKANAKDQPVKLKNKVDKKAVGKEKKLHNGTDVSKVTNKDRQTDKKTLKQKTVDSVEVKKLQQSKSAVENVNAKKSPESKNAKSSNNLTPANKSTVKPQKVVEKPKSMGKPTQSTSPKEKKKILNGKVEKRHEKKVQISKKVFETPKKVKFVLKNNSMQGTVDYYKSVRQSPSIPFDSSKKPSKTNLKVSTPSPINPFFKKKLRLK